MARGASELTSSAPVRDALIDDSRPAGRGRQLLAWLTPLAIAVLVYGAAMWSLDPIATGDEPSYYLIAHSIITDGDVDLANQYNDAGAIREACPVCPLDGPVAAVDYRRDGKLRPYHYLGLPLLMSPGVAVTRSQTGPRITVLVMSVVSAWLLFLLIGRAVPGRRWAQWLTWIAVAFCMPLTVFASQVYPEMPAVLFILLALTGLTQRPARLRWLVLGGAAAAFLPWLHIRMMPIAAALALLLVLRAWRHGASERPRSRRVGRALLPAAPLIVSTLGIMLLFNRWYGSYSLNAAYQHDRFKGIGSFEASFAYRNFLGSFLNPTFGLLPWAPVLVLGIVGLGLALRRSWLGTAIAAAGGLAYLVAANALSVAQGASPPARYEVVVAAVLAFPLAFLVVRWRTAAIATGALALLSLGLTVQASRNFLELFPAGDGGAAVTTPLAHQLAVAWPRFDMPRSVGLVPEGRKRTVGRLVSTPPLPAGRPVVSEATPADGTGIVSFGYGAALAPGDYTALVELWRAPDATAQGRAGLVRVLISPKVTAQVVVAARTDLTDTTLPRDGQYHTLALDFRVDRDRLTDVRVSTVGQETLRVGAVQIVPTESKAPQPPPRYPSKGAVLAWLSALALGVLGAAAAGARRGGHLGAPRAGD